LAQTEEEKRLERKYRRRLVEHWKKDADAIRDGTNILMREARAVALSNIEDAARSHDDFRAVNAIWDERDRIETWRLDKQEIHSAKPLMEKDQKGVIIPQPFDHPYWRQLLGGNFIDIIYDCPHEIHEMTASRPIYDLTHALDENRKEILYYWAIRLWSPQKIAAYRGQSDRNIRKVYNKMIDEIREKLYERLFPRFDKGKPLTLMQREFMVNYPLKLKPGKGKGDKK
jgi:hypothetical protein